MSVMLSENIRGSLEAVEVCGDVAYLPNLTLERSEYDVIKDVMARLRGKWSKAKKYHREGQNVKGAPYPRPSLRS